MLDVLMSELPEVALVTHTTELINSVDPSHSSTTEKCNSFPPGEGNMPLNNSYPRSPELNLTNALGGADTPSQEVDRPTSEEESLSLGNIPEELDQNHANGYTSGKNYNLPKQKSENSFDSMVVMLDGVTTTMSSSQSSSTDRLSVTLSEGEGNMSTTSVQCRMDNDGENGMVSESQNGPIENGTKEETDDTSRGVDNTSRGADDTSRGADDTSHGADDTSRGADDTSRGADDTSRGADDTSRGSDDMSRGEVATEKSKSTPHRKSNGSGKSEDTSDTLETAADVLPSDENHPTPIKPTEILENPCGRSSPVEDRDSDELEAIDLSSIDACSETSSRPISASNTASTLELKDSMSGIGDNLMDSILRQMDDEEGENGVARRKELRPSSVRLSSLSLGGQGVAGSSTPVGRGSNFGDEVDIDETEFVEINLQSCNSEGRVASERIASWGESVGVGAGLPSKASRLGNFLARNFTSKKSRDNKDEADSSSDVLGWKMFGRVPPKQSPQGGLAGILNEYRVRVSPKAIADRDLVVRRSDKEVPSTTALILQPRPSGLPTKDPEEDQKHKMMYEEMVEAARKSEQKEAKLKKKQREQQIRYEEQLSAAVRIWNAEILPYWETAKNSKRTQDMWWKGIPPSIRGKVWKLAIGNDLNVTSELYEICLVRATEKLKILRDVAAGSDSDSLSSFSADASGNRESSVDLIQLDVSRTFPQLCIFQAGGPYHKLLQGLLGAYVCYRPDVGYVQGMSFLAAVLLLNMDDVSSFVCFANLLNKPCEVAFFRLNENLMKAYFDTYQVFFNENLPKLYAHFEAQHITPDLYIIDWMYTLFAKSLPLDVASRVWDVFCRDGEEFLFRTALGILRLYEDILLHLDFIHLAQFLTRLPENISSIDLFHCIAQIRMQSSKCSFAQVFARNQCQ